MKLTMNRTVRPSAFAIGLLVVLLCQAPLAFACGPFSLEAVFTFTKHPGYPLENFARGEIGIVQPTYARSYLYVAYRYLKGDGFEQAEQQAIVDLWHDRLDLRWESGEEQALKSWLDVRQKVPGLVGPPPKIDVYRNREKPNDYESYLNCQNDAFETAAATLETRMKQLGADNPALKPWVEAQDQVFANCSEGQHIPAELPADGDALRRADRQYQIAAANFYSNNFDAARKLFASIASQSESPWRSAAAYLVARTLLRKASLGPAETKQEALAEAELQLNRILTTPELKASQPAAKRLLNIVRIRLHPEDRLHELALSLTHKAGQANLKQDLWDYTVLLDQFIGDAEAHHQKATPAVLHDDDLTDWIVTLQSDEPAARDHALARWETTSSIPWLVATLSKLEPQHPKVNSLQQAAAKVPPTSAAYPSVSFYSIRLDIAAGRLAEARARLDDLLRNHRSSFNASALNLLRHQRMLVSSNLGDFLESAPRLPAGFSFNEDGRQLPVDESEVSAENKLLQGRSLFDSDAGEILDRRLPLALLSAAAGSDQLPAHLRRDVAQAAWLRSVLLGDPATATALAPTLKAVAPELTAQLDEYVRLREPAAKKFSAIFTWLHFPGLEPVVDVGVGRADLGEQDSYRDNWWCSAATLSTPEAAGTEAQKPAGPAGEKTSPAFLTASQRAAAEKEYATLGSLGAAPNYLCQQVIEWATVHPTDPRVPEALHLAVKTTRYGCTDKQTGKWSRAAHDLLHRRYPGNEWAKKTPYWFKD